MIEALSSPIFRQANWTSSMLISFFKQLGSRSFELRPVWLQCPAHVRQHGPWRANKPSRKHVPGHWLCGLEWESTLGFCSSISHGLSELVGPGRAEMGTDSWWGWAGLFVLWTSSRSLWKGQWIFPGAPWLAEVGAHIKNDGCNQPMDLCLQDQCSETVRFWVSPLPEVRSGESCPLQSVFCSLACLTSLLYGYSWDYLTLLDFAAIRWWKLLTEQPRYHFWIHGNQIQRKKYISII